MEITRNVILDLLPLYLANEVSSDTRILIQDYLEKDTEMANFVKQSELKKEVGDIPVLLNVEDKVKTLRKTKLFLFIFTIIIAALMGLVTLAVFFLISQ